VSLDQHRPTTMIIAPKSAGGARFTADLVAYAEAGAAWPGGGADGAIRPVWAVLCAPEEQLRAFTANVVLGHPANSLLPGYETRGSVRLELLRSAGYRHWTRLLPGGGAVVTFVLPEIMAWELPPDPERRAVFGCMPALSWLAAQRFDVAAARSALVRLGDDAYQRDGVGRGVVQAHDYNRRLDTHGPKLALGALDDATLHRYLGYGAALIHYADNRLRYPIPRDPVFGAWLLLVGVENGPISMAERRTVTEWARPEDKPRDLWVTHRPEAAGCAPGFLFNVARKAWWSTAAQRETFLREWLAGEVQRWYRVQRRGVIRGAL
jgi:hypothetical protein